MHIDLFQTGTLYTCLYNDHRALEDDLIACIVNMYSLCCACASARTRVCFDFLTTRYLAILLNAWYEKLWKEKKNLDHRTHSLLDFRFHEFLKQENEVGNITRQEAVSMVCIKFLCCSSLCWLLSYSFLFIVYCDQDFHTLALHNIWFYSTDFFCFSFPGTSTFLGCSSRSPYTWQ